MKYILNPKITQNGKQTDQQAELAQSAERTTLNRVVKGSIPLFGVLVVVCAELAQSVERTTLNRVVKGSIPLFGVIFLVRIAWY